MSYQDYRRDLFCRNIFQDDLDDEYNNNNNNNNINRNPSTSNSLNNNYSSNSSHRHNRRNIFNNYDDDDPTSVWVFGYGSLCWYPGFNYSKCITGYIRGYVRRFWQGNTTHRGTVEKPGRVATLVEDKEGITWGCAYKISGETALEYLKQRECVLGGYVTVDTKFFPRVATGSIAEITGEAFPVLVYIATDKNSLWLGETSINNIAKEIVESSGPSGHNVEYLIRLAMFMKNEIPDVYDDHLFELEESVKELLNIKNIPLTSVMGANPQQIRRDSHEEIRIPISFEFTSRVPERKLRCLNI